MIGKKKLPIDDDCDFQVPTIAEIIKFGLEPDGACDCFDFGMNEIIDFNRTIEDVIKSLVNYDFEVFLGDDGTLNYLEVPVQSFIDCYDSVDDSPYEFLKIYKKLLNRIKDAMVEICGFSKADFVVDKDCNNIHLRLYF